MRSLIVATTLALASATLATAADDPIGQRQAMMKNVGAATGAGAAMVKGEAEFDARVGQLALRTMHNAALGYAELFPEGTETGGETEAAPAIFSDRAGFNAAVAKFQADVAATLATPPADLDAFKAAFGSVTQNCSSCHESYRVKKN